MVRFLSVDEVLLIHDRLVEAFGGAPGLRDPGLLESALYRPQTGYYADLAEMAAALFESLIMNHPFLDGNKRIAFFAVDVFLRLNGWQFNVESKRAHQLLIALLKKQECDFANLLVWIRDSIVKRG